LDTGFAAVAAQIRVIARRVYETAHDRGFSARL
jgi:hypothetical protein